MYEAQNAKSLAMNVRMEKKRRKNSPVLATSEFYSTKMLTDGFNSMPDYNQIK